MIYPFSMSKFVFGYLVLVIMHLSCSANGQLKLPTPSAVPVDVAPGATGRFNSWRASLLQSRDSLLQRVADHKRECSAVEEGSAAASNCLNRRNELISDAKKYDAGVAQYEAELTAARNGSTSRLSPCSQAAQLQNQFESVTQEIELDRQVVRNFGFDKTVEEIEYWEKLPERQRIEAKEKFNDMLFDATLSSASAAFAAVGSLTPEEADALNRLADAQGAPPLGIVAGARDIHETLEFVDKTKRVYETADAVRRKNVLAAAVNMAGLASKNPALRLLLDADKWAVYEVYQSSKAVKIVHDLTRAAEGDLVLLKSRSEKLRDEVNQLTTIKKQLADVRGKCDSTTLAR